MCLARAGGFVGEGRMKRGNWGLLLVTRWVVVESCPGVLFKVTLFSHSPHFSAPKDDGAVVDQAVRPWPDHIDRLACGGGQDHRFGCAPLRPLLHRCLCRSFLAMHCAIDFPCCSFTTSVSLLPTTTSRGDGPSQVCGAHQGMHAFNDDSGRLGCDPRAQERL